MTIPEAIDALPLAQRLPFQVIMNGVVKDGGIVDPTSNWFKMAHRCLRALPAGEQKTILAALFDEKLNAIVENGQKVEAFGVDGPYVRTVYPCSGAHAEAHIKRATDIEAELKARADNALIDRIRARAAELPDLDLDRDDPATKE